MKKIASVFWQATRLLAFGLGFGTVAYAFLPYARLKAFANSLAADQNLELFSSEFYASTRLVALVGGLIFIALFLLLTLLRQKSLAWLENSLVALRQFSSSLREDRKTFWQQVKAYLAQNHDWQLLLILMLVGAFFRVQLLDKSVYHDEAYTYITFVLGGLGNVISDYHLPNNHILYSVLVFFSTQLFGNAPWVLRLPALLAGLLLIPATYFAAEQTFNRATALLSSGMIAIFPIFMIYGTSARGYTQVALLSALLWFFGNLLLKHKNRYLWLLFVLAAAAGFYSVPIMLYPYTATMAWLFFSWLFKKHSKEYSRKEFFGFLFFSGVAVVLLFLLLYMPVFLRTGVDSVINNPTIQQHKGFSLNLLRDALRSRGVNAWIEWHWGMPESLAQLTLFGVGIALFYRVFVEQKYTDYFLTSLLAFIGIVFLQHSVGWRRVWFFFAPIYFSFAAGGIVYLLKIFFRRKEKFVYVGMWLALAFFTTATLVWWQGPNQEMRELRGEPSNLERGVLYLADKLEENEAILTNPDYTPQMQYYARYHGIAPEQTHPADNRFTSLYVILIAGETNIQEMLHSGTQDRVDLNASELIYAEADLKIYKIPIVVFYDE